MKEGVKEISAYKYKKYSIYNISVLIHHLLELQFDLSKQLKQPTLRCLSSYHCHVLLVVIYRNLLSIGAVISIATASLCKDIRIF